jgi:hypothetical protein
MPIGVHSKLQALPYTTQQKVFNEPRAGAQDHPLELFFLWEHGLNYFI